MNIRIGSMHGAFINVVEISNFLILIKKKEEQWETHSPGIETSLEGASEHAKFAWEKEGRCSIRVYVAQECGCLLVERRTLKLGTVRVILSTKAKVDKRVLFHDSSDD